MAEILVGYDGSEGARHALRVAADFAGPDDKLTVIFVYSTTSTDFGFAAPVDTTDAVRQEAEERLEEAQAILPPGAPTASFEAVEGHAPQVLSDIAAHSSKVKMIVVGCRGFDPLRAAIGSQTLRLLGRATCPVLVVPTYHEED